MTLEEGRKGTLEKQFLKDTLVLRRLDRRYNSLMTVSLGVDFSSPRRD